MKVYDGPRRWWECPCGEDPPKPGATTAPVRTIVSIREPQCPYCGKAYREKYERVEETPAA